MEVWKIIFLSKWVIWRFQPLIFQGVNNEISTTFPSTGEFTGFLTEQNLAAEARVLQFGLGHIASGFRNKKCTLWWMFNSEVLPREKKLQAI